MSWLSFYLGGVAFGLLMLAFIGRRKLPGTGWLPVVVIILWPVALPAFVAWPGVKKLGRFRA